MQEIYPHGRGAAVNSPMNPTTRQGLSPRAWGSPCGLPSLRPSWRGLSPRAWGSLRPGRSYRPCGRSIPTGVGQPQSHHPAGGTTWVYPHGRGAAVIQRDHTYADTGLSPRAWGSRPFGLSPRAWGSPSIIMSRTSLGRSIPTGVGQPPWPPWMRLNKWGLSPRAWGSRRYHPDTAPSLRSIPTGVGQPPCAMRLCIDGRRSIPTGVGQPYWRTGQAPRAYGLSPRAWGSLYNYIPKWRKHRSIPTGVGQPVMR